MHTFIRLCATRIAVNALVVSSFLAILSDNASGNTVLLSDITAKIVDIRGDAKLSSPGVKLDIGVPDPDFGTVPTFVGFIPNPDQLQARLPIGVPSIAGRLFIENHVSLEGTSASAMFDLLISGYAKQFDDNNVELPGWFWTSRVHLGYLSTENVGYIPAAGLNCCADIVRSSGWNQDLKIDEEGTWVGIVPITVYPNQGGPVALMQPTDGSPTATNPYYTITHLEGKGLMLGYSGNSNSIHIVDEPTGQQLAFGSIDGFDPELGYARAFTVRPSDATAFAWIGDHEKQFQLATIDYFTGEAKVVSDTAPAMGVDAAAFSPDGQMWAFREDGSFGTVDLETGQFAQVGQTAMAFDDVALSPSGEWFGLRPYKNEIYSVDIASGNTTLVSTFAPGDDLSFLLSIEFDSRGHLLGSSANDESGVIFDLDLATGAYSNVRSTVYLMEDMAFIHGVPEPSTVGLFLASALAVAAIRAARRASGGQ